MKKLIFLLSVIFLLVGCSNSTTKRYEIQKTNGDVEYVTASTIDVEVNGTLNFKVWTGNMWVTVAVYPKDTYKSCAATE